MSNTPRSPRASSGPPMISTTMTSPSARRSLTRAEDEPITLKKKACRAVSSVSHDRTGRPVVCSLVSSAHETQRHNSESEQIRTLLDRQREQILADCQAEIRKHEFQVDYDRRSMQKLNEVIESQKEEICRAHQGDERRRQDHQLLHEQLLEQNRELREAHERSLNEMEELKRFQGSTFDTIPRRTLVEDRDTILELAGKIQELQNEINCMSDSKEFQDAESIRSGQSHVASQPVSFPPHPIPGGMLDCRAAKMGRQASGTRVVYRETSLQIQQRLLQYLIHKNCINGIHRSKSRSIRPQWRKVKGKNKTKIRDASLDRQPKFQLSFVSEIFQRILVQTNNDCRSQIFISTNSPHQQRLLVGR